MAVPNQPKTPTRSLRVPDPVWDPIVRIAKVRGETKTATVIKALIFYAKHHPAGDESDE